MTEDLAPAGPRRWMTVEELAELTGVGTTTLYRAIKETGEALPGVPAIKIRARIIIPREPIERLMRGQTAVAS